MKDISIPKVFRDIFYEHHHCCRGYYAIVPMFATPKTKKVCHKCLLQRSTLNYVQSRFRRVCPSVHLFL